MVTFERRICGLIRYRRVFYPSVEVALQTSQSLKANEVLRLFGVSSELGDHPNLVRSFHGLTSCLDLSASTDQLLAAMKRKSCRYEIRRAEKMLSAVHVELNTPRAMHDFLELHNAFAKAKGPVPRLSGKQFNEFTPYCDTFVLYLRDRSMCCHLLLRDSEVSVVRLLHSGSRRLETSEDSAACGALNRYLHWYEIQRYQAEGIRTYDLGGIRYRKHPTAEFKLSFGGAVVPEHYYLFGGTPWLARCGAMFYDRFFKSAAPLLDAKRDASDCVGTDVGEAMN